MHSEWVYTDDSLSLNGSTDSTPHLDQITHIVFIVSNKILVFVGEETRKNDVIPSL